MSKCEFDREISPDEQLREVSLILMEAMRRVRRDGVPPRPPATPVPLPAPPAPTTVGPRPKRTLPKPHHAKFKPGTYANRLRNLFKKRMPQKRRFWLERVVSIDEVPSDELARVVCRADQPMLDLEFREAFDHVMRTLSPEERRLASLVAERGLTHAARELSTSWRQIMNALVRMREVFEVAGFGPDRAPRPVRHISELPPRDGEFPIRTDVPTPLPGHDAPTHTGDSDQATLRAEKEPPRPTDNNAHPLLEVPASSSPGKNGIQPAPAVTEDGYAALGGLIRIIEALAAGLDGDSLRRIGTPGQIEALCRAVNRLAGLPSETARDVAGAIQRVPRRMICYAACVLAVQRDPELRSEEQRVARFKAITSASRATYYRVKAGLASTS